MSLSEPPTPEGPDEEEAKKLVGRVLSDRYRIDRVLGIGGMGAVYSAEHLLMHKRVAIKVLHPEMTRLPEVVQRFEREAMAAAHIEHPHVATAYDFGKLEDGSFFLVLEFVEGKSLREIIEAGGSLKVERAVHITRQILQALSRAHTLGIVHRDLKPENVMLVDREDDPDFVKVLDFGIAKVPIGQLMAGGDKKPAAVLTQLGMVYGTPEYMAPEQALGQDVDHRADLYALGVLLFEMLVGVRPFNADNPVQILGMVVSKPVPAMASILPNKVIPPALEEVTRALLAKLSDERPADARAAIAALDAAFPLEGVSPMSRGSLASTGANSVARAAGATYTSPGGAGLPTSFGRAGAQADEGLKVILDKLRPLLDKVTELPRQLQIAIGGGIAFVVVVTLTALAFRGPRTPAPAGLAADATASASGSAAIVPDAPPAVTDDELKAASSEGVAALEALQKKAPTDGRVLRALAAAQAEAKQPAAAVATYASLLEAEPAASSDKQLRADLLHAAQNDASSEAAFALLEGKMGEDGPDVLYELMTTSKVPAKVQKKAKEALAKPEVIGHASAALKVAVDLRKSVYAGAGELCRVHRPLFTAARDSGDTRSLGYLRPLTAAKGCGFLRRSDCNPCLRDGLLNEAIAAIQTRAKGD
jgi:eukaryotic-like serine/threonine-protein kinase